jgi:hypothetical protein
MIALPDPSVFPVCSIEPLICGIEGGDGDIDDFELADGPVATAGFDEDGGQGLHWIKFAVEFHVTFAFEDQIDLRQFLVIVGFRVGFDVDEVDRSDGIVWGDKGAASLTTGTGNRVDFGEVGDDEVCHVGMRTNGAQR